jgi:hypothetical protein
LLVIRARLYNAYGHPMMYPYSFVRSRDACGGMLTNIQRSDAHAAVPATVVERALIDSETGCKINQPRIIIVKTKSSRNNK